MELLWALLLCLAGGSAARLDDTGGRLGRSLLTSNDFQYTGSAGGKGSGNGQFNGPFGMAVAADGNIFVADFYNTRVQKLNATGAYLGQIGNGQINAPFNAKIDSSGNIYVADYDSGGVQKFDSSYQYLGQLGTPGTGNGQFSQAIGLCLDDSDNLYVVDANTNRVQKFNSLGIFQWSSGSDGTGDGQFKKAYDCTVSGTTVYVTDTQNPRIQLVSTADGAFQSKFNLTDRGTFLVSAPDGSLFVSLVFAHTVQHLAADGTLLAVLSGQPEPTSFAPTGIAILQSDGGGAPLLVAVADTVTNTVSFFKRTL
ncbi:hypothetical protein ABPG77_004287 [Micractinium sp. CCAP 211/92]